jgi:hypothetical protein
MKLIVTACPTAEGFGVFEVMVVVVDALVAFVLWVSGPAAR